MCGNSRFRIGVAQRTECINRGSFVGGRGKLLPNLFDLGILQRVIPSLSQMGSQNLPIYSWESSKYEPTPIAWLETADGNTFQSRDQYRIERVCLQNRSAERNEFAHQIFVIGAVAEQVAQPCPSRNRLGHSWRGVGTWQTGDQPGLGARDSGPLPKSESQYVPFFFKQWGGVFKKRTGRVLDGRAWEEFPESQKTYESIKIFPFKVDPIARERNKAQRMRGC